MKRETIIAKIEDGGLRMPDIFAFHSAQTITTMKNLIVEDDKCLNLFSVNKWNRKILARP